jgi:hypothetical protein
VEPGAGSLGCSRESGTEHDRVGPAGDRSHDVTGGAHPPVGDDVDISSAGLVEVVTAGRGDIGDGAGHRRVDAQRAPRRVRCAPAESDEHTRSAGPHEVQGRRIGGGTADDDRHVELVDEPLEVERLGPAADVLGRHGGAADDEQVDARRRGRCAN